MKCHPGKLCEEAHGSVPPWWDDEWPLPNERAYSEDVLVIAGVISTMPPFDHYHPAYALPIARAVVEAQARQRDEQR